LTNFDEIYAKTRVSGQKYTIWGSRQYVTKFIGDQSPETSPKWLKYAFSSMNGESEKFALSRKPVNWVAL